jgi:glutamine amidotransferase
MGLKIPQIGWNSISTNERMPVLGGFNGEYMYFVHSYFPVPDRLEDSRVITGYGVDFTSAVEYENILACQFHPEKSGKAGLAILKKWTDLYL